MSKIYFYNTLSGEKEEFKPQTPGKAGMYTCGPTVYQYATIGNMRSYVFADILKRTLEYNDFKVKHVMNITDVGHLVSDDDEGEDKMALAVAKEKKTPWEIAEYYTEAFFKDTDRLNIKRPSVVAAATDHIPEMLKMVIHLYEKGYAYETSDGIYFDISKFTEYGKLSGIDLDDQKAGARVEVNPEKRHPADFALWKKAPKEHIMQWESPWGMGYPGWHIECSAMSRKYLGDRFDIHTGGVDHIPIHHENEIAQSQACTGEVPANYWMHGEFLLVDGGRMGKSLGNAYLIEDLVERGFEPLAFRYFCLSAHYRTKLNFTWEALQGAQNGLMALRAAVQKAKTLPGIKDDNIESLRQSFLEAVNDDLNLPRAMVVLWDAIKHDLGGSLFTLAGDFDKVLGLRLQEGKTKEEAMEIDSLPAEVQSLVKERERARGTKNWGKADSLREELQAMGYSVKDTPKGCVVTKIS